MPLVSVKSDRTDSSCTTKTARKAYREQTLMGARFAPKPRSASSCPPFTCLPSRRGAGPAQRRRQERHGGRGRGLSARPDSHAQRLPQDFRRGRGECVSECVCVSVCVCLCVQISRTCVVRRKFSRARFAGWGESCAACIPSSEQSTFDATTANANLREGRKCFPVAFFPLGLSLCFSFLKNTA